MVKKDLTILLIDDDPDDREIFSMAVKEIGPAINCIHEGYCVDAIETIVSKDIIPGYIFLDLNMPRVDGHTCLLHLKKIEQLKNVPIIIYTTTTNSEERQRLLASGADHFISKTNTFREIVAQLAAIIEP